MSFEISCHLRFYVIQDFMSFEILCVLIVTKVIVALMLKVVIKDRCVLKKYLPLRSSSRIELLRS